MRTLILLIVVFFTTKSFAQPTFHKIISNMYDIAHSVTVTADGGYLLSGQSHIDSALYYPQGCLVKTDGTGGLQWMKSFGGSYMVEFIACRQTSDGGYIAAGTIDSAGTTIKEDALIVKTDSAGNVTWSVAIGLDENDLLRDVIQSSDGNYVAAGAVDYSPGEEDLLLVKLDTNGDTLWVKSIGGGLRYRAYSITEAPDGGFVVSGSAVDTSMFPGQAVMLIKTNPDGNPIWTKLYNEIGTPGYGKEVINTADSGFVMVAYTPQTVHQLCVIKTDANGDTLWTRYIHAPQQAQGMGIRQTADQGYVVAGHRYGLTTDNDMFLFKLDANGDSLWSRVIGADSTNDVVSSFEIAPDGGLVLAGFKQYNTLLNTIRISLVKTDSLGNASCEQMVPNMFFKNRVPQVNTLSLPVRDTTISVTSKVITSSNWGTIIDICTGIGLSELTSVDSLTVFPNPNTGSFTVKTSKQINHGTFQVLNSLGEVVHEENVVQQSEMHISLPGQSPGLYFLSLTDGIKQLYGKILLGEK